MQRFPCCPCRATCQRRPREACCTTLVVGLSSHVVGLTFLYSPPAVVTLAAGFVNFPVDLGKHALKWVRRTATHACVRGWFAHLVGAGWTCTGHLTWWIGRNVISWVRQIPSHILLIRIACFPFPFETCGAVCTSGVRVSVSRAWACCFACKSLQCLFYFWGLVSIADRAVLCSLACEFHFFIIHLPGPPPLH